MSTNTRSLLLGIGPINKDTLSASIGGELDVLVSSLPGLYEDDGITPKTYTNKHSIKTAIANMLKARLKGTDFPSADIALDALTDQIYMFLEPAITHKTTEDGKHTYIFDWSESHRNLVKNNIKEAVQGIANIANAGGVDDMTKIIYAYMQAYQEDMTAKISQPVERATDPQSQKAVGKVKKYFQHLIEGTMVVGGASFTTYAGHGFIDSWITKMATNNVNNKLLKEAHDFSQTLIGQGIEWSASGAISGAMVYNIWRGMQKLREGKLKGKSFFESGRHLMATLALSSVMLVGVDAPGLLAKDAIKPILNTTASTATANLSDALQAAKNQTEKGMVLLHKGATDYVKAVLDGEKFNNVGAGEGTAYVSLKALEQDPRTSLNDPRLSDANMRTAVTALSAGLDAIDPTLERTHPGLVGKVTVLDQAIADSFFTLQTAIVEIKTLQESGSMDSVKLKKIVDKIKKILPQIQKYMGDEKTKFDKRKVLYKDTLVKPVNANAIVKYGRDPTSDIQMNGVGIDFSAINAIIDKIEIPSTDGIGPIDAVERLQSIVDVPHGISQAEYYSIWTFVIGRTFGFEGGALAMMWYRTRRQLKNIAEHPEDAPDKRNTELLIVKSSIIDNIIAAGGTKVDGSSIISYRDAEHTLDRLLVSLEPELQKYLLLDTNKPIQPRETNKLKKAMKWIQNSRGVAVVTVDPTTGLELYNKFLYQALRQLCGITDNSIPLSGSLVVAPEFADAIAGVYLPQFSLPTDGAAVKGLKEITQGIGSNNQTRQAVYGTEIKNTDAARSMAFKASIPDIMKQLGTMKQQYKDEISLFIARLELWIDKNNPNDDHLNIILIHSIKAIKPLLDGLSEDTLTLDKWSACTMKWEEVKKEMKRASDDGI